MRFFHILILIFPLSPICQTDWKFGGFASAEICSPRFKSLSLKPEYKYATNRYSAGFGFNVGATAVKKISSRFELELSLSYSRPTFALALYESPDYLEKPYRGYLMRASYLNLPVSLNFLAGNRKVQFIGCLGFDPGLKVGQSSRVEEYDLAGNFLHEGIADQSHFPNYFLNLKAGAGVSYAFEKITLRVLPVFQYGILPYKSFQTIVYTSCLGMTFCTLYEF